VNGEFQQFLGKSDAEILILLEKHTLQQNLSITKEIEMGN